MKCVGFAFFLGQFTLKGCLYRLDFSPNSGLQNSWLMPKAAGPSQAGPARAAVGSNLARQPSKKAWRYQSPSCRANVGLYVQKNLDKEKVFKPQYFLKSLIVLNSIAWIGPGI